MNWEFLYYFLLGPVFALVDYAALIGAENHKPKTRRPHGALIVLWMAAGLALVALISFGIPKLIGFEFEYMAFLLGLWIYLVWKAFSHRRWKKSVDRFMQVVAEVHGLGDSRIADLRSRKLFDFVSWRFVIAPYVAFILFALGSYIVGSANPLAPSSQSQAPFHLVFALYGLALLGFVSWRMVKTVQAPIDLRSSDPGTFASKTHEYLRKQVRLLVVFQYVSILFAILAFWMYQHSMPYPVFVTFGLILMLLCGLWVPFYSMFTRHRLERERWSDNAVD
jgi:hypothetical protein